MCSRTSGASARWRERRTSTTNGTTPTTCSPSPAIHVFSYVFTSIYLHIYIHSFIYIHICIHVYIYVYTYMFVDQWRECETLSVEDAHHFWDDADHVLALSRPQPRCRAPIPASRPRERERTRDTERKGASYGPRTCYRPGASRIVPGVSSSKCFGKGVQCQAAHVCCVCP